MQVYGFWLGVLPVPVPVPANSSPDSVPGLADRTSSLIQYCRPGLPVPVVPELRVPAPVEPGVCEPDR